MDTLLLDLKMGLRSLSRAPVFTASAVLALALGIGASSAIFAFCDAMLLRPFAFDDKGLVVATANMSDGYDRSEIPGDVAVGWRDRATQLTQVSFYEWSEVNLTAANAPRLRAPPVAGEAGSSVDEPEHVIGYRVDPSFFSVLPVRPLIGRPLSADPRAHEVVLSWALWQRRFNGDEHAVGQETRIDGESYTIAGVMPRDFRFPKAVNLWLPLLLTPANALDHGVQVLARLKPGANLSQARQELAAVHQEVLRNLPRRISAFTPNLFALRDYSDELSRLMLWVLMAAVLLLLLIGCANVGNMLLARASGRWREIAIRGAMGASRGRLLRQLLTESVLLSVAACVLGVLFAGWGIDAIRGMIPPDVSRFIPGWDHVGLDPRLLAFSLAAAAATAILSGLAPALRASRVDLHGVLQRESATASTGSEKRRFRNGLLLGQTLLAVVLAVCGGLLVRSFMHQLTMSYGFEPGQVLTLRVAPSETRYRDDASLTRYTAQALGQLRALPGVESASTVSHLPLSGMSQSSWILPEGMPPDSTEAQTSLYRRVSSEYFHTLRIPILAGRPIDGTDVPETPRAVVLSKSLAERLYGSAEAALGHRLRTSRAADAPLRTVVGVAADVRQADLRESQRESVYVSQAQSPDRAMAFVLRTTVPPMSLGLQARQALRSIDADQPVSDIWTMAKVVDDGMLVGARVTTVLLSAFALVSLLLTAIGLYGAMSYGVAQRRREIGIRLALGAVPADVVRLVVREGMSPALWGLLLGIPAALGAGRALGALLIGVAPTDPLTFGCVAVFLCAVALAASWAPARRAARTDPGIALRAE